MVYSHRLLVDYYRLLLIIDYNNYYRLLLTMTIAIQSTNYNYNKLIIVMAMEFFHCTYHAISLQGSSRPAIRVVVLGAPRVGRPGKPRDVGRNSGGKFIGN